MRPQISGAAPSGPTFTVPNPQHNTDETSQQRQSINVCNLQGENLIHTRFLATELPQIVVFGLKTAASTALLAALRRHSA